MKQPVISTHLNKSLPLLRVVTRLPMRTRKRVLNELGAEKTVYKALHELATNTLNGEIPLSKVQKRRLKPHRATLEHLCDPRSRKCAKKRRKLIVQSGGFLPIILKGLAYALPTLLTSVLSK